MAGAVYDSDQALHMKHKALRYVHDLSMSQAVIFVASRTTFLPSLLSCLSVTA